MKLGDVLSGKYRLEQEIGKGAMGAVWAAYDHTSNRRVALKAILPQAREHLTTDLRQRLLREARACRKLSHRHIVQIFDVGETPEGEPSIILELLQGQTLGERIKEKRRIEPAIAARIAAEVASGLAVAHAAQVIHRDLKPANIFLHREEGMPDDLYVSKVLDFGVCKTLDSVDSVATQTGTAVGSPAYMSPEQVGMRKDLDHRTDIWSLGIVLFEMLTGSRPFSGPVQDVIRNILLTPVPPPSSKVRDVPPELDAIVARCTAGKREARFANAEELSRALFEVALTARPMTRKATFTGYGTPPALQSSPFHERPSNLPIAGVSASSPIATPPAGMGSTPEVDESEQAATLPFQGRMLMDMRPGVPQGASGGAGREVAPSGTVLMPPSEPVASPAPAWNRNEMQQALAAHRQSSSSIDAVPPPLPEQGVVGGNTQMVTDSQMPPLSVVDPVGTTSGAGALSQRSSGYPLSGPLSATDSALATGRRKQTKKVLFAAMAGGIVAAIGVLALIVASMGQIEQTDAPAAANETKPEGTHAAGAALEVTASAAKSPPSAEIPAAAPAIAVTAEPTAEPTATPAPPETEVKPAVVSPPPSPVATYQAPPKPTTYQAPPKPTAPAPTVKGPILFDMPEPKSTAPKAAPPPKCTGEGIHRKCTK